MLQEASGFTDSLSPPSYLLIFLPLQHATQSHTLALTSHYDSLLSSNSHAAASSSLHASTALSSTLSHLGSLIRSALRDAQGEGESDDEEEDGLVTGQEDDEAEEEEEDEMIRDPFQEEGYRVGSPSGIGPSPKKKKSKR